MSALLIIGDILVCGFLAALVAWLFIRVDDAQMDAAARIPLEDDEPPMNGTESVNRDE